MEKIFKKYVNEQLDFNLEYYLDGITHEFAFNWNNKDIGKSSVTSKQELTIKKDLIDIKAKSIITVLGVAASKDFVERILQNLPFYERTTPLIVELARAISNELKQLDLKKSEYVSTLNITTANAISLKKLEDIYGIHNNYEIGVKLRQGILVAREITRYSIFNFFYLLKIAELFDIGKVVDIVNDKKKHLITIKITSDTNNGVNVEKFLEHLNELGPAIYSYKVEQVS